MEKLSFFFLLAVLFTTAYSAPFSQEEAMNQLLLITQEFLAAKQIEASRQEIIGSLQRSTYISPLHQPFPGHQREISKEVLLKIMGLDKDQSSMVSTYATGNEAELQDDLLQVKDSLKSHYFNICLTPFSRRLAELIKLSKEFGIQNPVLDNLLTFANFLHQSAMNGNFDDQALKSIISSLVRTLNLRYKNGGSEDLAMASTQRGNWNFLYTLFKDTIRHLEKIPAQQFLKNFLTLVSSSFSRKLKEGDVIALNNTANYFLDYFLERIDSIKWTEEIKDAMKDTVRHIVPGALKRILSNGDELSMDEKRGLLKSLVRLFVKVFDSGAADNNPLFNFADQIFLDGRTKDETNTGIQHVLSYLLRNMLTKFPSERWGEFGNVGLLGCLDTLKELYHVILDNLPQLLSSGEQNEGFDLFGMN